MKDYIHTNPLTTFLLGLTLLVSLIGGVICVIHPETLSFSQLLDRLQEFAIAIGLVGVGHGVLGAGERVAQAQRLNSLSADPDDTTSHDRPVA